MTAHTSSPEMITAALLQELIAEAPRIARDAHHLLAPMARARDALRTELINNNLIVPIADPHPAPATLAAVDGGSVREPLYALDLMVVVAASAQGMNSTNTHPLVQDHWSQVVVHHAENDRLLSAAMASRELALLGQLAHDIRILDGSTTSHILTLWGALGTKNPSVRNHVTALIDDDILNTVASLGDTNRRTHPGTIVAMAKSDSSQYFMHTYRNLIGVDLPGGDRFMAAQILNPGEMLYPRPAHEHSSVAAHVPHDYTGDAARVAHQLQDATAPLRAAIDNQRLLVTYLKPETADTVIKVEVLTDEPLADTPHDPCPALRQLQTIARHLSDETPGPHMQEPFAQYAVDLAAKSVSVGANALNQAMLANLPAGSESYLSLLARSYRTTTTTAPTRPGGR